MVWCYVDDSLVKMIGGGGKTETKSNMSSKRVENAAGSDVATIKSTTIEWSHPDPADCRTWI